MTKTITILLIFLGYAFAKAQTVEAGLITNIKQNDETVDSNIDNVVGTIATGALLYDNTRTGAYVYDGIRWRRVYFAPSIDAKTTSYTLQASDVGNVITFNSTTDVTLTVPPGLDLGFNVSVYQLGTGRVIFQAGGGATILNRLSRFRTAGPNAGAGIMCTAANTYHITGDLKQI
ncbi:hypothetical protein EAX61_15840 [Dokdonia sinensis]|uniref:T9SS C-terminal target domain-containing protein n=1 Tax=Dokdonia sinensis TaxID=2479847 RepID=A0A3M0FUD2_9FLAO|nr:hypothetical protein [Dokdonia sinensis]RMB56095.1 hypothetical protein EAX61_15840 [Dokdonia sinensis]